MNIHIIMHESFEVPWAIATWIQDKHHSVSYTYCFNGDQLPNDATYFDMLIIMWWPQSPATTLQECPYFDAKYEIALIQKAIANDKIVLGVCLGAQLIGEALGATFEQSPHREIGVFEITITNAWTTDAFFWWLTHKFPVGHWHGDMPGLTENAEILAYSDGCPRQIVKYAPKVYGFQCHFEFTPESIEWMIQNCSHELVTYKWLPYIQDAQTLRANDYNPINNILFKFLDYITSID